MRSRHYSKEPEEVVCTPLLALDVNGASRVQNNCG